MTLTRSLAFATLFTLSTGAALATPSSTYWTPMTLDIQSFGVLHWGVDNYFTAFRKADNGAGDVGNSKVLVDAQGKKENTGFMAAFDRGFKPVTGPDGAAFNRLVLAADYASGNNALGGGGVGLYYYFTRNIDLLTGPVWFNEESINGKWKWTIQLDINVPSFGK